MNNKTQIRRLLLLLGFFSLAFAGLGYRLVDLQVVRHDELSARALHATQLEFREAARRGDILDATGNLLATSVPVKTICADPALIGAQAPQVAHAIAPVLNLDEAAILQRLLRQTVVTNGSQGKPITNAVHYVRLARNVPEATWAQVYATMTNLPAPSGGPPMGKPERAAWADLRLHGLHAEANQARTYPLGSLAGQVIGFAQEEENRVNGQLVTKLVGHDGIEKMLEQQLGGVDGWRVTEADKHRHELVSLRGEDVQARDGLNVVLTIDAQVQHIVETELAAAAQVNTPQSITGIVMRPRTGEILAMASLPSYDPGKPDSIKTGTQNRVITEVMEPGSTFKIVVISGALNSGVVKMTDEFNCEHGQFIYAGRRLHDHVPLDILTTKRIITKSSNIGAAKIGIQLGEEKLYDYAWNFGFGQRTGLPLPGEVRGMLPPVKSWSKVSIAQIPMGQGVAVTRLQMLDAMATIANGGWLMQPMIVSRLQQHDGTVVERYTPKRIRQVIGDVADREMVEALKTVVTADGTAPEAALKNYVVAGKTGTAQKPGVGGYSLTKFFSSFIGFFPADHPELCISVVMDEPKDGHYGGKVCGPVFRKIAERCASYLNIPPDPELLTNAPPLVAGAAPIKTPAP